VNKLLTEKNNYINHLKIKEKRRSKNSLCHLTADDDKQEEERLLRG
jgi:hypothetical protein